MYETTLNESAFEYAEKNLNETVERRITSVEIIKNWLESSKNQFNSRTDFIWILSFLRVCKFDIEKTKQKITTHLKLRATTPEWFAQRDPFLLEIQELLKIGVFIPLRQRDSAGRLVIIVRIAAHDPSRHTQNNVFKTCKMILDVALQQMEEATIYGVVALLDMRNITFQHVIQLTPSIIKKAVTAWENYYCSPKSINFIYSPSYINIVLNIFRQFMSSKLKQRVHVYGISYDINNVVSTDILPREYGGNDYNLNELIEYWKEHVENAKEWFINDEQYKAIID